MFKAVGACFWALPNVRPWESTVFRFRALLDSISFRYTIELDGYAQPLETLDGFGTKVLAVFPGGQLDMHGAPVSFAWSVLDDTADVGATSLVLAEEPLGWKAGQEILLVNTALGPNEEQTGSRTDRNERCGCSRAAGASFC